MKQDYRNTLFAAYSSTHADHVDPDDSIKRDWFIAYAKRNYFKHLENYKKTSRILEIGCNRGFLLAALNTSGYTNLHAVDLSPEDVENARTLVPSAKIYCADGKSYLNDHPEEFDVIVTKAVLEHIQKENVMPLLRDINRALKPGGIVIIDVPNMDWLFAFHERYMDFTHEVGFTRESLSQLMRNVFSSVAMFPGAPVFDSRPKAKVAAALRPAVVALLSLSFKILGDGAGDIWWGHRSLIGIGTK